MVIEPLGIIQPAPDQDLTKTSAMKTSALAMAVLLAGLPGWLAGAEPLDMRRRAKEVKDLQWGMSIRWSMSTFSGKDLTPGVKDMAFFKPSGCDTDQWARSAKEAEMGYIIFLAKHHDGFCMWDTRSTMRKVTKSPLGRDVLAELHKSCDKYGIKLALCFAEGEFADNKSYHPRGYQPDMKKTQLRELLTQFGPIEFLWIDHSQGDGGMSHADTTAWCKLLQPKCFIGYNGGQVSGDIRVAEWGRPGPLVATPGAGWSYYSVGRGNYLLSEFTYPILPAHEGGAKWFYSQPKHDNLCLSADKLFADYRGAVKYGNIFSLDVGPDKAGKLRDIDVRTLREVGEMIRQSRQVK